MSSGLLRTGPCSRRWLATICLAASIPLTPTALRAAALSVNGGTDTFGALPVITFGLAQGTDILPLGAGGFFFVGLFDTGSTEVFINAKPGTGLYGNTDAFFLGISSPQTVDVRVNGLAATDPVSNVTPIGAPGGAGAPQLQVSGIEVTPNNQLGVSLIGAPVANQAIVRIDYTTEVVRPIVAAGVRGPDITFFGPAGASAFASEVEVVLEPFGQTGTSADGGTRGQRYLIRDVTFNEAALRTDGASNRLLYDTGTNVTLLSAAMAQELGLNLVTPDFVGEVGGVPLKGYTLDSIVLSGVGGEYTVNNARIFVDESATPFGGAADGIIGSNLFRQTSLLFDGIGNRLGIGVSAAQVPEPPSLLLFAAGLLALLYRRSQRKSALGA